MRRKAAGVMPNNANDRDDLVITLADTGKTLSIPRISAG
jgi:hypothetical protein